MSYLDLNDVMDRIGSCLSKATAPFSSSQDGIKSRRISMFIIDAITQLFLSIRMTKIHLGETGTAQLPIHVDLSSSIHKGIAAAETVVSDPDVDSPGIRLTILKATKIANEMIEEYFVECDECFSPSSKRARTIEADTPSKYTNTAPIFQNGIVRFYEEIEVLLWGLGVRKTDPRKGQVMLNSVTKNVNDAVLEAFKADLLGKGKKIIKKGMEHSTSESIKCWCRAIQFGLEKRADDGDKRAQYYMGYFFHSGPRNPENRENARKYFQLAAEQGVPAAHSLLGEICADERYGPVDYDQSLKYFLAAAEMGHVDAFCQIGCHYSMGQAKVPDIEKALHYFHMAADRGCVHAHNNIASVYMDNIYFSQSERGLRHYRLAAEEDSAMALFNLAVTYASEKGDHFSARMMFEKSAELGYVESMYECGKRYEMAHLSQRELVPDLDESLRYYEMAMNEGNHHEARWRASQILISGWNVQHYDLNGATSLLSKVEGEEERGSALKLFGLMYQHSLGTHVDRKKALECFREARPHDHEGTASQTSLAIMMLDMATTTEQREEALEQLRESAFEEHILAAAMVVKIDLLQGGGDVTEYEREISCLSEGVFSDHTSHFFRLFE